MSKKTILTFACVMITASFSFAQSAPASAPVATNSHKAYDQKARECRKAGADKQLTGNELRAFVAICMAPPKATTN